MEKVPAAMDCEIEVVVHDNTQLFHNQLNGLQRFPINHSIQPTASIS